jgi:hypothetical protein
MTTGSEACFHREEPQSGTAPFGAPFQPSPLAVDAEAAFVEHLLDKARAGRARYGPDITAETILEMLDDPAIVRYPTGIHYDRDHLQPHEFAWPRPLGFHPANGYCILIDPFFEDRPQDLPLIIAYHIPSINYGAIVEARHAELFAAALLGLDQAECYERLCILADSRSGSG